MSLKSSFVLAALLVPAAFSLAQQSPQLQLKIDGTNRTLTVSAEERVTVDPEIAVIHIGFETKPEDSKSAYAEGAHMSKAIMAAIKQAGIPEIAIRSESQSIEPFDVKSHRFKLLQQWTVRVPPARAAEILDLAVTAGATDSGQIDWTVKDVRSLETQALEKAANRAREDAAALAKGMGAKLGAPIYMTNEINASEGYGGKSDRFVGGMEKLRTAPPPPLAIEPDKVVRTAAVYAVFAIE